MLRTRFDRTLLAGLGLGAVAALVQPAPVEALDISLFPAAEQSSRDLRVIGLGHLGHVLGMKVGFRVEHALGRLGFDGRLHGLQAQGPRAPQRADAPGAGRSASAPAQARAPLPAEAPDAPAAPKPDSLRVVSSEVNISRDEAVLQLGFADGRDIEFAIREGRMFADGRDLGAVPQHGPAERAWRSLLNRAVDVPATDLPTVIRDWAAPSPDGALKNAMLDALSGAGVPMVAQNAVSGAAADSLERMRDSLESMREKLQALEEHRAEGHEAADRNWGGPFRYFWRGLAGLTWTLIMYALLFAVGIAVVFFGGRPHLEAVADTARRQMGRSFVVGLAGSFLVLPAYILGAIALAISIVGIPVLLVWVPLFPAAVILALLLGYLGSAHAAGEALAERRFYGGDWFRRGNSYYFLMTGLGLLLVLFAAGQLVEMAGPWLGFIHGLLAFMGVVVTWFAFTTGLGAVLLTRGGTRPTTGLGSVAEPDLSGFEEETRV